MSGPQLRPLKQIRLVDQISDHIRVHISDARLKPGDTLPSESELARDLGVGRPSVREAMNALAGMGIVRVSSGKAPVVGSVTGESINQLVRHAMAIQQISLLETLELRRILEMHSVGLAATYRTEEHVQALVAILAELSAALGDLKRFSVADIAFHKLLAQASGNTILQIIVEGISDAALASSLGGLLLVRSDQSWKTTYDLHDAIARAVIEKNADAATEAMQLHFDNALTRVSAAVGT